MWYGIKERGKYEEKAWVFVWDVWVGMDMSNIKYSHCRSSRYIGWSHIWESIDNKVVEKVKDIT